MVAEMMRECTTGGVFGNVDITDPKAVVYSSFADAVAFAVAVIVAFVSATLRLAAASECMRNLVECNLLRHFDPER